MAAKAKAEPGYRFYALYDKICREDLLWHAWRCCRANGGRAGVDGESLEQIEEQGVGAWLARLQESVPRIGPWTATPGIGSGNG